MIRNLRRKFLNRTIIQQHYFNIYHKLFSKKRTKKLFDEGYSVFREKFPFEQLSLDKYLNYGDYDFVTDRKIIDIVDLKIIYNILVDLGVISVVKHYFRTKIYAYENSILTLGNKICHSESWQPHHDAKGRRIKIYIWLNEKDLNTHPLFYLKSTHKDIRNWDEYEDTRFRQIDPSKFDSIYGENGSIIIFDTHGIHSHFKTTIVPRSVIELTFEPFGIFNRLNKKTINDEKARLNMIDLDELI